ncbi:MAG: tetratricopeptide repeat protein [Saprospiraceae bacterium]|nr:tetratricopeptide repeat protein [Saprospiraceae bacterium]
MNPYLERARQLISIERLSEAETEIRKALGNDPDDGEATFLLAVCKLSTKQFAEALTLAERAVALAPDSPVAYLVLGRAYFYNKKLPMAREAVTEGLRIAPYMSDFFRLRAEMAFYEEKWELALEETENGLELDPEDVALINLRAQALIKLNRKADAATTLDYALHKAPEDSDSHANKGWVAIEQDHYEEAVQHFLEALRLDPDSDYARHGLKEAIKGKNLFYRGILKYFLWMNKLQEQGRWAFVIGAYVLYRILLSVGKNVPALAPLVYPLAAFYVIFAFSSWIAKPLSNLFLRFHPLGKHALSRDEMLGSNVVGGLVLASLAAFGAFFLTDSGLAFRLGLVLGIMTIPAGGAFNMPEGTDSRRNLLIYAAILALLGLLWALLQVEMAIALFGLGVLLYSLVANYFIGKEAKTFR